MLDDESRLSSRRLIFFLLTGGCARLRHKLHTRQLPSPSSFTTTHGCAHLQRKPPGGAESSPKADAGGEFWCWRKKMKSAPHRAREPRPCCLSRGLALRSTAPDLLSRPKVEMHLPLRGLDGGVSHWKVSRRDAFPQQLERKRAREREKRMHPVRHARLSRTRAHLSPLLTLSSSFWPALPWAAKPCAAAWRPPRRSRPSCARRPTWTGALGRPPGAGWRGRPRWRSTPSFSGGCGAS